MNSKLFSAIFVCLVSFTCPASIFAIGEGACAVVQDGTQWELKSPFFVYRLTTDGGLRAKSWSNLLSNSTITLSGTEIEIDLGDDPQKPIVTPLSVVESKIQDSGLLSFKLEDTKKTLVVVVNYKWDAVSPCLHKFITITNNGNAPIRILNVRIGAYASDAELKDKIQVTPTGGGDAGARTGDKEQGFPLYLNDDFFMSLAHPAGWSTNLNGFASLRQYPAVKLAPQESFECMEAVYGVGNNGEARKNFVDLVRSRMRRVVRQHDVPYIIYDNFGSWKSGDYYNREEYVLESLAKVAKSQEAVGRIFDICNIHFWVDHAGDLKKWDKERFPNGYEKIRPVLEKLGIKPGLWIDSSWGVWSIGYNPDTKPSLTHRPTHFCRASEPIKSMYKEAFISHIREKKIRLLKFDNLHALICNNPEHDHLPGIYSVEAIENSVIEFLHDLDAECPELFIMLYWGYRSPWWLLHGDTLFDSGGGIEAASPSQFPSLYVRDSVTQKLDQCHILSDDDPWLGKDSLGVWLSDWGWNSGIGKEGWQEGVVMDICRGSLLLQIWSDYDFLSPPEWEELADFTALLKSQPKCFANPKVILGNPHNPEPYGYCCSDGNRAFLAINNCTWEDSSISLELSEMWGLPNNTKWDLYRWYPNPAKLTTATSYAESGVSIQMKPFEVALIEVVPTGEKPTLNRTLPEESISKLFSEKSGETKLTSIDTAQDDYENEKNATKNSWSVLSPTSLIAKNGSTLTLEDDNSIFASGNNPSLESYVIETKGSLSGVTAFRLELLPDTRLPSEGPGRGYNGNIALNDFSVSIISGEKNTPLVVKKVSASFSQQSHGGYQIENAIDGKVDTAWSVYPLKGTPIFAVFELEKPATASVGDTFLFVLSQGYSSDKESHNIGRFRLSATNDKTVLQCTQKRQREFILQTESPKTEKGGILVVTTEVSQKSVPHWFGDVGRHFSATAKIDDKSADCTPIIGQHTYAGCWQGWRIDIAPNSPKKNVELRVVPAFSNDPDFIFKSRFIPNRL